MHTIDIVLTAEQSKRLSALKEVFHQQSALARKQEVKHRIASIDPPLHPSYRQRQGEQARGIRVQGQQHTD